MRTTIAHADAGLLVAGHARWGGRAPTTIAPHPENSLYFLFQGKPTFLITHVVRNYCYGAFPPCSHNLDSFLVVVPTSTRCTRGGVKPTRTFSGPTARGAARSRSGPTPCPPLGPGLTQTKKKQTTKTGPWARSKTPGAAAGRQTVRPRRGGPRRVLPPYQRSSRFCKKTTNRGRPNAYRSVRRHTSRCCLSLCTEESGVGAGGGGKGERGTRNNKKKLPRVR